MTPPARARQKTAGLPLSALLSQVLVAFTVELDNEFERLVPHRTARHGSTPGNPRVPWLVSLVMWSNFMRFIPQKGITARELLVRTGLRKEALRSRIERMAQWWGYLVVTPPRGEEKAPLGDWIVRPSPGGLRAQQIWESLLNVIEERWVERFGKDAIVDLRASLVSVVRRLDTNLHETELPEYLPMQYLPILGPVWGGWFAEPPPARAGHVSDASDPASTNLPALLSRVLLAFSLDFERGSDVSLAIGSNLVRVLNDTGVPIRDLPRLTGVSKEAIKMMLGFLGKYQFIAVEVEPAAPRTKLVRLTAKGLEAQEAFRKHHAVAEGRWRKKFGDNSIHAFRFSLERLTGPPDAPSPLLERLQLNPEGWRASLPAPATLPHYPLVLHRGGFPDGS